MHPEKSNTSILRFCRSENKPKSWSRCSTGRPIHRRWTPNDEGIKMRGRGGGEAIDIHVIDALKEQQKVKKECWSALGIPDDGLSIRWKGPRVTRSTGTTYMWAKVNSACGAPAWFRLTQDYSDAAVFCTWRIAEIVNTLLGRVSITLSGMLWRWSVTSPSANERNNCGGTKKDHFEERLRIVQIDTSDNQWSPKSFLFINTVGTKSLQITRALKPRVAAIDGGAVEYTAYSTAPPMSGAAPAYLGAFRSE